MFPEINDSKVANMFMYYSKKDGLKKLFANEAGQDSFIKIVGDECHSNLRSHVRVTPLLSVSCKRFSSKLNRCTLATFPVQPCIHLHYPNNHFISFAQSDDTSEFLSEMSDESDTLSIFDECPTNPVDEKDLRESITRMMLAAGDVIEDDEDSSLPSNVSTRRLYSSE